MPKLTWIGHSAFLLEDDAGNVVAVDPFIIEAHRRFRMWKTSSLYNWDVADARFDLATHPTEPFRSSGTAPLFSPAVTRTAWCSRRLRAGTGRAGTSVR